MREVAVADAFAWLHHHHREGPLVAVPPDAAEIGIDLTAYVLWLHQAAKACIAASAGPTVLGVTDRKHDGRWLSKATILVRAAEQHGVELLWHKIGLRRSPGKIDLHRPGYRHWLAFGPGRPGRATPDVFEPGPKLWTNGAGTAEAELAIRLLKQTPGPILNPFCGRGTFLAAANAEGLDALGCDNDEQRAAQARSLTWKETP